MRLVERVDSWGRSAPARVAHLSGDRSLTYGELAHRSDLLAARLGRLLAPDGAPVAVHGHKEPEMLIAFLGAIKAGHPYLPIDAATPPHRVEQTVAAAGAPLTLTPAAVADLIAAEAAEPGRPARSPGGRRFEPEAPCYIIFTSGSSGEPKGVLITMGCLESFQSWMLREQDFAPGGEIFLNQAPFSFDLSVMDYSLALETGGTLFSITSAQIANPSELYRALSRSGVTVWVSTPSFAQMCLSEKSFAANMLPRLHTFLFCGETLAPETAAALLERFPEAQVWNTYGPTEATVATTSVRVDRRLIARYRPLPVGYPKPDSRVLVLQEDGNPAGDGERGEIVIAGPHVSPGYIGRPDLTARAFFTWEGARAYRTGDWGRLQDGMLFFEGRRDSQIKIHGYRIELGDIEANLQALPGVRDAIVIPKHTGVAVEGLVAFVILGARPAGSDFEIGVALRRLLSERLPVYMLPRQYRFLEAFPLTPNGKADRRKLAEMLA